MTTTNSIQTYQSVNTMPIKEYSISDVHTVCGPDTEAKYMRLLELHQKFMSELANHNSFAEFLKRENADADLISFVSCAVDFGVEIIPLKSALKWNPPSGYIKFP